jgi:hypothetical protein
MLDGEDYENMNIHSKIHRRKIEVELRRIFNPKGGLKGIDKCHAKSLHIITPISPPSLLSETLSLTNTQHLKGISLSENHAQKREKIRKAKIYKESATTVQRVYRGYVRMYDLY